MAPSSIKDGLKRYTRQPAASEARGRNGAGRERTQNNLGCIRRFGSAGPGAPYRVLIVPPLTVLILAVLWVTILERLRVEKDAALQNARVAARAEARALETHTLKTIHDVDEIALFFKYGYESSPATVDLKKYRAFGLFTADRGGRANSDSGIGGTPGA